jgi:hypothetical protein
MGNDDTSNTGDAFRGRAAQLLKMVTACGVLAAALGGMVWYGDARGRSTPDAFRSPPFVDALRHRDWAAFVRAIDQLPSIDTVDAEGITPLLAVVACGDDDELAYLLARGADVNWCHHALGTPLMVAVAKGDVSAARMLLRRGADATRLTSTGDVPLLAAVRGGSAECVRLVLAGGAARDLMPPGILANPLDGLDFADGDEELCRLLLAAGVDPNRTGRNGQLPLVSAALMGSHRCVSLLLAAGANPDLPDGRGRTARALPTNDPRIAAALRRAQPAVAAREGQPQRRTRL